MVPIVFFGLLCLGPYAVTGDNLHWLPEYVPWPGEQCIQKGFLGECDLSKNTNNELDPYYKNISPCRSLKCAWPKPSNGSGLTPPGYDLFRTGRPVDGTLVGLLQACRQGRIVEITADRIPTQIGSSAKFYCESTDRVPRGPLKKYIKPKHSGKI